MVKLSKYSLRQRGGILASIMLVVAAAIAIGSSSAGATAPQAAPKPAHASQPSNPSAKISAELRDALRRSPDGMARYVAVLATQANVENDIVEWNAKGRYVLDVLRKVANTTQPPVAAYLRNQQRAGNVQSFKSYYIINAFQVRGNLASTEALAALPEVARLQIFPEVTIDEPVRVVPAGDVPEAVEWNVGIVHAPQAWALGYNGAGVTIGSLDTGVRYTHQALVGKYRGNLGGGNFNHNYNWWDTIGNSPFPIDGPEDGHGTHTTGTIVGDDGAGNQVGVAPGAKWIATNGIATGVADADIIEGGQFMLAPWDLAGQNPDPSKRPVVVGNSWGYGVNAPACVLDEFFHDIILAWRAAGIFPSFSAGNGFPQGNRVPAAYPETFETGAINFQGLKSSFSGSGPSCYDGGQHPQIMAAGGEQTLFEEELIRSAYNTSDTAYEYLAGTSMAQPATAGAVAILKQVNPNLTITQTWFILTSTAHMSPTWGPRPNPEYGWGLLQIDAAVLAAQQMLGTATPTVTGTPPTATPTSTASNTAVVTPSSTPMPVTPSPTAACVITANSTDVPKIIPDLPVAVPVTSSLTIANGPVISSIDVINLRFTHTWAEDLDVYLISPQGTRVELFTDICGDGDFTQANTGFTLSERGGITIGEACPPLQSTFQPEGSLAALVGQPSSGTWVLEVTDDTFIDSGTLEAWGLRISSNSPCVTGTVVPSPTLTGTPPTAIPISTATNSATAISTVTGTPPTATASSTTRPTNTLTPVATGTLTSTVVVATSTPALTATNTIVAPTNTLVAATGTASPVQMTTTPTASTTAGPRQGVLLIPDSTNDRVMAFDPFNGNLINANFVPADPAHLSTPKNAILSADGNSVLVVDQLDDAVQQYDLNGNYIGVFAPAGGVNTAILNNSRGIALRPNGNLLATVGDPPNEDSVAEFDTAGNYIGNFVAVGAGGLDSPWDVYSRTTDYLVSAVQSDAIHRYSSTGAFLGILTTVDGFPQQIAEAANGNVLVANFSPAANGGVLEYTADGTFVGRYAPVNGNTGVYELGNGNILTSNGTGVHEINRSGQLVSTKISGVSSHSIEFVMVPAIGGTATPSVVVTSTGTAIATSTSILPTLTSTSQVPSVTAISTVTPVAPSVTATGQATPVSPSPTLISEPTITPTSIATMGTVTSVPATVTTVPPSVTVVPATETPLTGTSTSVATNTVAATATTSVATSTSVPPTSCPLTFSDVPPSNTFYQYVRCLVCRGIISGYNDNTFRPNNDITRGQIAKIVSQSAGFSDPAGSQIYEDVPEASPFYTWIQRLSNRGLVGGYPCGLVPEEPCVLPDNRPYFRPNASATRGQLSKIVASAAGITTNPTEQTYEDVGTTNTFYVWIEQLTQLGVMGGYPCGTVPSEPCGPDNRPYFRPSNNVTRGQASKIVANTFFPNCVTPGP
jgi:subtilisin family serine protease/subtilisin-like proprotein convertase family protein